MPTPSATIPPTVLAPYERATSNPTPSEVTATTRPSFPMTIEPIASPQTPPMQIPKSVATGVA
jgi:hypothetical protein